MSSISKLQNGKFKCRIRTRGVSLSQTFRTLKAAKTWGARKRAGVRAFRVHDLRHTCASLLAQAGRSLHEIANVLGHRSLSTTQRYAHFCIESKRAMVEDVLGNLSGKS